MQLRFEHPTLAGAQKGGWMTPEARRLPGAVLTTETRGFLAEQDTHAARAAAIAALAPAAEAPKEAPKLVTKDSTVLPNAYTSSALVGYSDEASTTSPPDSARDDRPTPAGSRSTPSPTRPRPTRPPSRASSTP